MSISRCDHEPFSDRNSWAKWQSSVAAWEVPIIEEVESEGTAKKSELELETFLTECVELQREGLEGRKDFVLCSPSVWLTRQKCNSCGSLDEHLGLDNIDSICKDIMRQRRGNPIGLHRRILK